MNKDINDQHVHEHINKLVAEEERLYAKGALGTEDQKQLKAIGVQLDRYWDLLRQRRALREFGDDPSKAEVRDASIVEKYEQ
jgi:hypothetical protein